MVRLSINPHNTPHANNLAWVGGEWDKLHIITSKWEYCPANFVNGKRKNKFAKGIQLIILDFDENVTLQEGIELFSSFKSLIVTTKSHQVEKNGIVNDRFRVILYLAMSIIDMNYYSKLMREITRHYKSDTACSDGARYYSPNPKQKVYYSNSKEIFDITRFDAMIDSSEDKVQKHITRPTKKEQPIQSTPPHRIELSSLLDIRIDYYINGMKTQDTLKDLIKKTKPSEQAISCRCFLNPNHEDNNPSCFIYHNEHSIYAKCVSCQIDGFMYI